MNPASAFDGIIRAVLAAPGVPGPAEAAMAQVVAGAVPAPANAAAFSFPGDADILAGLTAQPAEWPKAIKRHLEQFTVPAFEAIPATTVPATSASSSNTAWN